MYVINLDKYKSIGTQWIALHVNGDNVTYFDSFGVEHRQKAVGSKNILTNIYRIQAYSSIMYENFCTGFIDFMIKGERFLDCTNLCSPNKY